MFSPFLMSHLCNVIFFILDHSFDETRTQNGGDFIHQIYDDDNSFVYERFDHRESFPKSPSSSSILSLSLLMIFWSLTLNVYFRSFVRSFTLFLSLSLSPINVSRMFARVFAYSLSVHFSTYNGNVPFAFLTRKCLVRNRHPSRSKATYARMTESNRCRRHHPAAIVRMAYAHWIVVI